LYPFADSWGVGVEGRKTDIHCRMKSVPISTETLHNTPKSVIVVEVGEVVGMERAKV
jgi:hypothetical protein